MTNKCIIHNGRFAYELIVDEMHINFQAETAANYFETHYRLIGYEVVRSGDGSLDYNEVKK